MFNMLDTAKIIVRESLERRESRGAYWRLDCGEPETAIKPATLHGLKPPEDWRPHVRTPCSGYLYF